MGKAVATRPLQLIVKLLALGSTILLTGCVGDGGGTTDPVASIAETTTSSDTSQGVSTDTFEASTGECPFEELGYYDAAWHQHLPSEQQRVHEKVLVCSDGTDLILSNQSDQVWIFDPGQVVHFVNGYQPEPGSDFFRSSHPWPNKAFMVPGDVVMLPGGARLNDITWNPDVGLTVAWNHQELATDYLSVYGAEYVDNTVKKRTPHSKAVASCALAGFETGAAWAQIDASSDSVDHVQAMLKTAGAATCTEPMKQADAAVMSAAGAGGPAPGKLPPIRPSWQQQVSKFTGSTDDVLDYGKHIGAVLDACAVLPRC